MSALVALLIVLMLIRSANAAPARFATNGHYYDVIEVASPGISWSAARTAAESLTYQGTRGHLATITSAEENQFLVNTFGSAQLHGRWLGGFQPAGSPEPGGGWQWVTGEPFAYTNWHSRGEPSNSGGNEDALQFADGAWNDLSGAILLSGYVVEYPVPACTYAVAPTSLAVAAAAGTGSVTVTASSGCAWTASSGAAWLTITAGSSGSGPGTVSFSVAENQTSSPRTGTLTIAGQTVTVTQAGMAEAVRFPANGHYYAVIDFGSNVIDWNSAKANAEGTTLGGTPGHLATITSAAENQFLIDTFGLARLHGRWLGGFQPPGSPEPGGGWQWVTGEPFVYTNWHARGEPSNSGGSEDALQFADGAWNDLASGTLLHGYVVEFDVSIPEPDARPVWLTPAEGAVLAVLSPTAFSWTPVAGAQAYLFEYTGPNLAFTNPRGTAPDPINGVSPRGASFRVSATSVPVTITSAMTPGTYQVRVAALDASGRFVGTFSEARSVTVPSPTFTPSTCPDTPPALGASLTTNRARARTGDVITLSVSGRVGETAVTAFSRTNAGASFRGQSLLLGTDLAVVFTCQLSGLGSCSQSFTIAPSTSGTYFFQAARSADPTFASGTFSLTNGTCITIE